MRTISVFITITMLLVLTACARQDLRSITVVYPNSERYRHLLVVREGGHVQVVPAYEVAGGGPELEQVAMCPYEFEGVPDGFFFDRRPGREYGALIINNRTDRKAIFWIPSDKLDSGIAAGRLDLPDPVFLAEIKEADIRWDLIPLRLH